MSWSQGPQYVVDNAFLFQWDLISYMSHSFPFSHVLSNVSCEGDEDQQTTSHLSVLLGPHLLIIAVWNYFVPIRTGSLPAITPLINL